MDTREAYNNWAGKYDDDINKTRDLEARALRESLNDISFNRCLEIGCGTGKNTSWFINRAKQITAVDFSEEMLARAKNKISSEKVQFVQANILDDWAFRQGLYDLVSFSLVLEHIENLGHIFRKASESLIPGGHIYIGELHPFKQYKGTKARFEREGKQEIIECFNHHLSDFIRAGNENGLILADIKEYFDEDDSPTIPRILTIIWEKPL
ncbi:MAG TPA: class I SAM-dependent methyltransferase [Puia sp.]|nr:class I SAM-dependent methyltransferase [Puia sp.]